MTDQELAEWLREFLRRECEHYSPDKDLLTNEDVVALILALIG
jgi:hypothetical protein